MMSVVSLSVHYSVSVSVCLVLELSSQYHPGHDPLLLRHFVPAPGPGEKEVSPVIGSNGVMSDEG